MTDEEDNLETVTMFIEALKSDPGVVETMVENLVVSLSTYGMTLLSQELSGELEELFTSHVTKTLTQLGRAVDVLVGAWENGDALAALPTFHLVFGPMVKLIPPMLAVLIQGKERGFFTEEEFSEKAFEIQRMVGL